MDPRMVCLLILGLALASEALTCPGCPLENDINDPSVLKQWSETLSKIRAAPGGTEEELATPLKLKKVTSQVVSGIKYTYYFDGRGVKTNKLYECQLVVLDRPWDGGRQVLGYNCKAVVNRNKRSIYGGEIDLNFPGDERLSHIQTFIAEEVTKQQKSQYQMGVVKVLKASKKVVSGLLMKLTVEVAETNCLPGASDLDKCSFQKENHQVCNVEIWERAWLQSREVKKLECNKKPYFCAGCTVETSSDDVIVNQCLKRALFNLNSSAHSTKDWQLRKIIKVQAQVVAGLKYTVEFQAEDETKTAHICNTVIISQPWISQEPSVVDFLCTPLFQ